jgi:DNA-binding NtrC family response regulator
MSSILIIEDDKAIVDVLRMILEHDGYEIDHAFNGPAGLEKYKSMSPDVVLLDIRMPRMDGIEVLQEIKKMDLRSIVIMISGHGNIETAVQTTKLGAYDFISKPFDVERLRLTIQNGLNYQKLLSENEIMRKQMYDDERLIGKSEEMQKLKDLILKVASTSSRILVTGESGSGKELAAKEIHRQSERRDQPFIHVNCATIPANLIEVELFGSVEGFLPYSPAKKIGKLQMADKGTLFLDEVADLSLDAQGKLHNALNENKIEPLGSNNIIPIDVRIISSTNRNLIELINEGKFREDLYHRLNVINIKVPPLRERREDIPDLVSNFAEEICRKNNIPIKKFNSNIVSYLKSLNWHGNVRELKNTVERLIILSDNEEIDKSLLEANEQIFNSDLDKIFNADISLHDFQDQSEKIFIEKKLAENSWNISKTAESLNIQRSHLYTKIKQYNIEVPNKD